VQRTAGEAFREPRLSAVQRDEHQVLTAWKGRSLCRIVRGEMNILGEMINILIGTLSTFVIVFLVVYPVMGGQSRSLTPS